MGKFLKKIAIYSVVCLILLNVLALVADYFLGKSEFYKAEYVENHFGESQNFDYAIFGSSRGLTTLDSQQIDSALGTNGVNLSCDDTDLKTHLLMLRHTYASGHQIRTAVLTLDATNFKQSPKHASNNDYRFAPYADRVYVYDHFQAYERGWVQPLAKSRYVPITAYSYYNFELFYPALLTALNPQKRNRFDERGNYSYPTSKQINPLAAWKKTSAIGLSNPLLKDFLKTAEQHGTDVIVYIAPYYHHRVSIRQLNKKFQLVNHAERLGDDRLFYDVMHVNKKGRKMATEFFIKAAGDQLLPASN